MKTLSNRSRSNIVPMLLFVTLWLAVNGTAGATLQIPDRIIYKGIEAYLYLDWFFPSPLQTYFINKGEYPFRATGTAGYRGHVATWEVLGDQLYLNRVYYHDGGTDCQKDIPLGVLFNDIAQNDRVNASWFTGLLRISISDNLNPYAYVRVRQGKVIETCEVTAKNSRTGCSSIEKDYEAYIDSFQGYHTTYEPPSGVAVLNPYTGTEAAALDVLKELPGYNDALSLFEIKEPRLEYKSCSLQGVYAVINPIHNDTDMRITWKNRLGESGYPYNWHNLITTHNTLVNMVNTEFQVDGLRIDYTDSSPRELDIDLPTNQGIVDHIEWNFSQTASYVDEFKRLVSEYHNLLTTLSMHTWLLEWQKTFPSYTLKLNEIVTEDDKRAWKLAGLKGDPTYIVWLEDFDVHNGFANFLMNTSDSRVLIPCSSISHAPKDHMFTQIGRFCTVIDSRKYVVVEPSGQWHTLYSDTWRQWLHKIWSLFNGG